MEDELMDRRQALSKLSAISLSFVAGCAAVIGVGFLYPIPRKNPPAQFICLESEIPAGELLEIKDPQGRRVLLIRKVDGTLLSIRTVCTHLGCAVFYRPATNQFECPCHQGVFDGEGKPVSGPPQRPLDHYPTEVREGKIFIQFA